MSTTLQDAASWDKVAESIGKFAEKVKGLASVYQTSQMNETRLMTIMKQRMRATDDQVASIKKLTKAQTELGILGGSIQLAGAQQLATFLYQKDALAVLIPAMNNLVAQQRGYEASASDAVAVANLMGKAMMGQTSALRRVGITFSESEEAAIKNGNEMERAAMPAQIITNNVGEMNAALAKTDAGKQKQLENSLGGVKKTIGSIFSGVSPWLGMAASIANIAVGFNAVRVAALKALTGLKSMAISLRGVAVSALGSLKALLLNAGVLKTGTTAAGTTRVALNGLRGAIRGLLIGTGVGAIIWGLSEAVDWLCSSSDKAADRTEEMRQAAERARKEYVQWKKSLTDVSATTGEFAAKQLAEVDKLYKASTDLAETYKARRAAAKQLREMYPTFLGQLSEEAIMTGKAASGYERLRQAIIDAAMARAIESKLTELGGQLVEKKLKLQKREWVNQPEVAEQERKLFQGAKAAEVALI